MPWTRKITTVVVETDCVVKLFRRLDQGVNPNQYRTLSYRNGSVAHAAPCSAPSGAHGERCLQCHRSGARFRSEPGTPGQSPARISTASSRSNGCSQPKRRGESDEQAAYRGARSTVSEDARLNYSSRSQAEATCRISPLSPSQRPCLMSPDGERVAARRAHAGRIDPPKVRPHGDDGQLADARDRTEHRCPHDCVSCCQTISMPLKFAITAIFTLVRC